MSRLDPDTEYAYDALNDLRVPQQPIAQSRVAAPPCVRCAEHGEVTESVQWFHDQTVCESCLHYLAHYAPPEPDLNAVSAAEMMDRAYDLDRRLR